MRSVANSAMEALKLSAAAAVEAEEARGAMQRRLTLVASDTEACRAAVERAAGELAAEVSAREDGDKTLHSAVAHIRQQLDDVRK